MTGCGSSGIQSPGADLAPPLGNFEICSLAAHRPIFTVDQYKLGVRCWNVIELRLTLLPPVIAGSMLWRWRSTANPK